MAVNCKKDSIKYLKEEISEDKSEEWNSAVKNFSERIDYSDIEYIFVENEKQKMDLIHYCKSNSIKINYGEIILYIR